MTKKSKIKIGVVDYGMGNLHSVAKALALQGGKVTVSDDKAVLQSSDLLVLPGVGSFGAASQNLSRKKLDGLVRRWIEEDKPYLGICLGFQLLFDESEEDPGIPGLGVLSGRVVKFNFSAIRSKKLKVPHMGWNTAERLSRGKDPYYKGLSTDAHYYFVHTFYPVPQNPDVVLTETDYGGRFCSSVARKRLFACQFHPEKSGDVGLHLLKNVIKEAS